ncbi:unnamed protein product [Trifolium pratense]|uniref:Uncharacterized protein n=1 Tax=Trifolium pratense TaxID=57577 RepID=A0ACB0L4J1_TRIPR|nr:unnamed protein product [Trifolium pratense]
MNFVAVSSKGTWHPIMTSDTTIQSYWLNWKVLICVILIILSTIFSSLLIWKYEVLLLSWKPTRNDDMEIQKETSSSSSLSSLYLYEDETWKPCLKGIHPAWLLAFRVFAFILLLVLLILTVTTDGGSIFYYYTQWTFSSVTIYFGLGCVLSMHGCYQYHKKASGDKVINVDVDSEQGIYETSKLPQSSNPPSHHDKASQEHIVRQQAGIWGYMFQILFQINAGAVILTDCAFWFIIVPFLTIKDYNITLLTISMHTINAVFLLGDTALNCLRFPWFRIGYFCLWTVTYVIFQWIVHAIVKLWWPYTFLDLSSHYAPLCYFSMALLHIPCYGIFILIMKLKHNVLSTRFLDSYQCGR